MSTFFVRSLAFASKATQPFVHLIFCFLFHRYRALYWNNLYKDAVLKLSKVAAENNLTLLEASLRWMIHHSGLGPTDAVIIGSSSVHHLEDNLVDLAKGPLPTVMVAALDEAWEHVKVACPCYFN